MSHPACIYRPLYAPVGNRMQRGGIPGAHRGGSGEQPTMLQSNGWESRHANCPIQACSDATVYGGNLILIAWCKRPGRPELSSAVGAIWGSGKHGGLKINE